MGEERFARWLGDGDWRESDTLHRLFESADDPRDWTGVGPAPPASKGSSLFSDRSQCSTTRGLLEGARVTVTCLRVL